MLFSYAIVDFIYSVMVGCPEVSATVLETQMTVKACGPLVELTTKSQFPLPHPRILPVFSTEKKLF